MSIAQDFASVCPFDARSAFVGWQRVKGHDTFPFYSPKSTFFIFSAIVQYGTKVFAHVGWRRNAASHTTLTIDRLTASNKH